MPIKACVGRRPWCKYEQSSTFYRNALGSVEMISKLSATILNFPWLILPSKTKEIVSKIEKEAFHYKSNETLLSYSKYVVGIIL